MLQLSTRCSFLLALLQLDATIKTPLENELSYAEALSRLGSLSAGDVLSLSGSAIGLAESGA